MPPHRPTSPREPDDESTNEGKHSGAPALKDLIEDTRDRVWPTNVWMERRLKRERVLLVLFVMLLILLSLAAWLILGNRLGL